MIVMKRILKIISGVAVSAAGIWLIIHWGPLGFVVGSILTASWFAKAFAKTEDVK